MIPHFYTNNLQSTISYYTNILCFDLALPPGELDENSCMLSLGNSSIIFEERKAEVDHSGWGKINLFVENLAKIFANVSDFADVRSNPASTDAGTTEFSVRDCNGIELVFSQVQAVEVDQAVSGHSQS